MSQTPTSPSNWWMYHGDPSHSGMATGSNITSQTVKTMLKTHHEIELKGPILSVPAIVDGYAYVGTANSKSAKGGNGGTLNKVSLETGDVVSYEWSIDPNERDSHGFTGMGCTPAVIDGKVYFSAFDGCVYCLDQQTMALVWKTNLRHADLEHNQPADNVKGLNDLYSSKAPPLSGWSSPVVVNGSVYVGVGEGENPQVYGFVYCLDGQSGNVKWLFCTNKFFADQDNKPNVVPLQIAVSPLPSGFAIEPSAPVTMGSSVWTGIAYDEGLNRLYCSTGNPSPDGPLPTPGYTNGILALDATTGNFCGFRQFPKETSYRPSDIDVDIGGSATLYNDSNGKRVLAVGCKNGGFMILDAATLEILQQRNLLPYTVDGSQIPTVDPHPKGGDDPNNMNPVVPNEVSNEVQQENFFGTYSTPAVSPQLGKLFMGVGGNNYHLLAAGIDTSTTPFLRAMDWMTLKDAWPMASYQGVMRYVNGTDSSDPNNPKGFYATSGESGLSVPAVVNDVVFMGTSFVRLYAFNGNDGTLLWSDEFGSQTGGDNGGYGYCLGPAISGDFVVAGALVYGGDGGILKIYKLQTPASPLT